MISKDWNLIREITWTDFKLRYSGSIIGFAWSFLKPLMMLAVLYIIFSLVIKNNVTHYASFLLTGIIMWNFLVESTMMSMNYILVKRYMIKAVYFPRYVLPLSSCLNAFLTLSFNSIILIIILIISGISLTLYSIYLIPIIILLFMLSLGLSFALSALYVRYRDVLHIWDVLLQVGFWASPIVYDASMIPERFHQWYMLNPVAGIVTGARNALVYQSVPAGSSMFTSALICIVILAAGYVYYNHKSKYFAEEL